MARVNYGGEKRRKELKRLAKQEEKRLRKLERKNQGITDGESAPAENGDAAGA